MYMGGGGDFTVKLVNIDHLYESSDLGPHRELLLLPVWLNSFISDHKYPYKLTTWESIDVWCSIQYWDIIQNILIETSKKT